LIGTSHSQQAPPHHVLGVQYPQSSLLGYPPLPPVPNFEPVDIDELSAGLGLPGAKKDTDWSGTSKQPHKSRPSQDIQNVLYGKLIDKALNKPLTANKLAQYLSRSPSGSSDETIRAVPRYEETPHGQAPSSKEYEPPLKVVLPPPGFANQMPRMVTVEDEVPPTEPALMRQKIAQAIAPDYLKQFTKQTQPEASSGRHAHRPSTRRRPRVYTRTKRTDQGPEPSAADIYPDDATWTPRQPIHQSNYATESSPYVTAPPQEVVRPEDPTSWPTPAEVHKHKHKPRALVPTLAHIPQVYPHLHQVFDPIPKEPDQAPQAFDVFSSHSYPSAEDMHAADTEVLSLIDELPDPTITTLINFGAFDLIADDRPLSSAQQSGKRYGLNYYGIGLGDDWQPPRVATGESFELPLDLPGYKTVWQDDIKSGWSDASWR
jgi:hypothetical protein